MGSASGPKLAAGNRETGNDRNSRRCLIVNADDFGKNERATEETIRGIDQGVVTSASIMPNMPYARIALKEAMRRSGRASFGVHLTLCEGKSLTGAATLTTDNNEFSGKRSQAFRALIGMVNREELKLELRAQIALVKDHGISISYLDSHKHLHHLPPFAGIVAELATEFGISRIRCAQAPINSISLVSPEAFVFQLVRRLSAKHAMRCFDEQGRRSPDRYLELSALLCSAVKSQQQLRDRHGHFTELVCHFGGPRKNGYIDEEMLFLRSSGLSSLLDRTGFELATYWDL